MNMFWVGHEDVASRFFSQIEHELKWGVPTNHIHAQVATKIRKEAGSWGLALGKILDLAINLDCCVILGVRGRQTASTSRIYRHR